VRRARHGLVIGKFYPPHAGHHLLISRAAAESDRVTVLVLSHEVESIPHADRLAWLREVHAHEANVTFHGVIDDHPVDFDDPDVWDLHEAVFRTGVAEVTDEPVTAVFSSEDYGAELARRLEAEAVTVDAERGMAPVSGTAVRADPVGHWDHLAAPVRAWFARRVAVVGGDPVAVVEALRARGGAHALTQLVPAGGDVEAAARAGGPVVVCEGATPAADLVIGSGTIADALAAIDDLLATGWDLAHPRLPRRA
jgi:HTH-type transcriptional repressor of NAD biosynthesis genes